MSDPLRLCRPSPARLLCLWDSPGKNTGVGCHALLQGIFQTQGLNPRFLHLLHWQAASLLLVPPENPTWEHISFLFPQSPEWLSLALVTRQGQADENLANKHYNGWGEEHGAWWESSYRKQGSVCFSCNTWLVNVVIFLYFGNYPSSLPYLLSPFVHLNFMWRFRDDIQVVNKVIC